MALLTPHSPPTEPYFQLRRKLHFINITPLLTSKMNFAKMFYNPHHPIEYDSNISLKSIKPLCVLVKRKLFEWGLK